MTTIDQRDHPVAEATTAATIAQGATAGVAAVEADRVAARAMRTEKRASSRRGDAVDTEAEDSEEEDGAVDAVEEEEDRADPEMTRGSRKRE